MEKIPENLVSPILTYNGNLLEIFSEIFAKAREAWRKRDESEKDLWFGGQRMTFEEILKLLNECHELPDTRALEAREYYDFKSHQVQAKIPVNAKIRIRELEGLVRRMPGAKMVPCPPEVRAWLETE